jgi:hypothetical protein
MGNTCSGRRCRQRMRQCRAALLASVVLLSTIASADDLASCKLPGVVVAGMNNEANGVCAAINQVIKYFENEGIQVGLQVTVRFQHAVYVEAINDLTNLRHPLPVSGVFRPDRNEIQMVDSESAWKYRRRPWKLPWDRQLADSILQHEIVHAVISHLMGSKREKLPRAWHEALAYAVQIDLMDEGLRTRVLAQYPNQEPFSNTLQINDFIYGLDPDAFAVAAYKTYVSEGRIDFLNRAIALEHDMLDVNELLP